MIKMLVRDAVEKSGDMLDILSSGGFNYKKYLKRQYEKLPEKVLRKLVKQRRLTSD